MNERIRQLAEQAGFIDRGTNHTAYMNFDHEKFAELIVRECLNQCYNRGMNDELYAGQLKAATYIEEHFGIENLQPEGVAEGSESDAYGNTGEKHECGSCDGTGIDTYNDECPECGGKGWVRDKEEQLEETTPDAMAKIDDLFRK
jgi:RecJ-like exonuclease